MQHHLSSKRQQSNFSFDYVNRYRLHRDERVAAVAPTQRDVVVVVVVHINRHGSVSLCKVIGITIELKELQ